MAKDHYISKFYIKQFSHREDKKVFRYKIGNPHSPVKLVNSSEICYKEGLFTRTRNGKIDKALEERFGKQESEMEFFISNFNQIAKNLAYGILKEIVLPDSTGQNIIKENLIYLLLFQLKRCIAADSKIISYISNLCSEINHIFRNNGIEGGVSTQDVIIETTKHIFQTDGIFEILSQKNIDLIFNNNINHPFILSDFPIYTNGGWKYSDSEIIIPLGPFLCIKMYGNDGIMKINNIHSKNAIEKINLKIIANANTYIIYSHEDQANQIEKLLNGAQIKPSYRINNLKTIDDYHIQDIINKYKLVNP